MPTQQSEAACRSEDCGIRLCCVDSVTAWLSSPGLVQGYPSSQYWLLLSSRRTAWPWQVNGETFQTVVLDTAGQDEFSTLSSRWARPDLRGCLRAPSSAPPGYSFAPRRPDRQACVHELVGTLPLSSPAGWAGNVCRHKPSTWLHTPAFAHRREHATAVEAPPTNDASARIELF